jgi:beta-galactosidase/beta-glucuronidase
VLTALVVNGVYPDPYLGTNNMRIPDAHDGMNARYDLAKYSHLPDKTNPWSAPYWYRTEFVAPAGFAGKTVWLNFAGINYRADVWLNGHRIADAKEMAGMFQRFRFDVTSALQAGKPACLAVRIHPLDVPGDPVFEQLDLMGSFGPNGGDGEIARNVTHTASIGWDWVPAARDRNMGIWQDVWLEATGPVAVRDPFVVTKLPLPDTSSARLTVRLSLRNAAASEKLVALKVRIMPDGIELVKSVAAPAQSSLDLVLTPEEFPQLLLGAPKLWWPLNYGDQNLYRLSIEATVDGKRSDSVETPFGIREVTSTIFPTGGRAFYVNGRKIRMTGGSWVPDFLMNFDAQHYRDEARLMALGNHTLVRINGCGITAPDVFYDACDRLGVLVWQEFWRTSSAAGWSPKETDAKLFMSCARDAIRRIRNHPSLVLWDAANEAYPQRDILDPLQDAVQELDGTRLLLPSSGGRDPEWAKVKSEVYTGGPWHWAPERQYFDMYATQREFGFRDEVGVPSMPDVNAIRKMVPDYGQPASNYNAYFPINVAMTFHDAASSQFRTAHEAMLERFGRPAGIADYAMAGQFINNDSYRAIFEAMNKNYGRNGGTLLWKTNAAWPSFMWQVFDWNLRANAGYYSMMRACRPLHVQFNEDDNTVSVLNTRDREANNLAVSIDVFDADMHALQQMRKTVTAAPDQSAEAGHIDLSTPNGPRQPCFLRLILRDGAGRELDRNAYWLTGAKNPRVAQHLPPVELDARIVAYRSDGEEAVLRISVSNPSERLAMLVNPTVVKGPGGDDVLPAFWSDNYLSLFPKDRQELTVRFRKASLGAAKPFLVLEGWNVAPRQYDVSTGLRSPLSIEVTTLRPSGGGGPVQFLDISLRQSGGGGTRITTWPVAIEDERGILRTFRVGLFGGRTAKVRVPIQSDDAGTHAIRVGGKTASMKFELTGATLNREVFETQARSFASPGQSQPALAIDGRQDTAWVAPLGDGKWFAIDLGASYAISSLGLNWGANYATEYSIQISSDGHNWKDVVHEPQGRGGDETRSFPSVETRYVRLLGIHAAVPQPGVSLKEVTVK